MPGQICSVAVCKTSFYKEKRKDQKVLFFTFPKDPILKDIWISRCYREGAFNVKCARICSKHFTNDDYEDVMRAKLMNEHPKRLKSTAVPTLNLKPVEIDLDEDSIEPSRSRKSRRKRISEAVLHEAHTDSTDEENDAESNTVSSEEFSNLQKKYDSMIDETTAIKRELEKCKSANGSLQQVIAELNKRMHKQRRVIEEETKQLFCNVFTENQMDAVLQNRKTQIWNNQEIGAAFTLRYFNRRSYLYLKNTLKYPLPGIMTLRRWLANANLKNGILNDVFTIMEAVGRTKTEYQKLTVLSFDKISVTSTREYDPILDAVVGPHSSMHVVVARGLFEKWQQPIYVSFDVNISQTNLLEIITRLHGIKYIVVACVTRCETPMRGIWKSFDIRIKNPSIEHPVSKMPIYIFADAGDLLGIIRNCFVENGFVLASKGIIEKELIEDLINKHDSTLTVAHTQHETVQKRNIELAIQLFSHETVTAVKNNFPQEEKAEEVKVLSDFLELIANWFNLMNTSMDSFGTSSAKQPYGKNLGEQNLLLVEIIRVIRDMRCLGSTGLQVFQKSLVISALSLKRLYKDLKERYGNFESIPTSRLNLDCVNCLASQLPDNPTPLEVVFTIRSLLFGKKLEAPNANDAILSSSAIKQAKIENVFQKPRTHENIFNYPTTTNIDPSTLESNGLTHIAITLTRKYKDHYPDLSNYVTTDLHGYSMPSWAQQLSSNESNESSGGWVDHIRKMEHTFRELHFKSISKGENVAFTISKLLKTSCPDIPKPLVDAFSKQRLLLRLKYLNIINEVKSNKRPREQEEVPNKILKSSD